jgi:hypothetical protein
LRQHWLQLVRGEQAVLLVEATPHERRLPRVVALVMASEWMMLHLW